MTKQTWTNSYYVFRLGAFSRTAGTACWESACPSEGNDLCDSCSGQTETWGLLFVTVAPPRSLEAVKAVWEALSISSCDWTWSCQSVMCECAATGWSQRHRREQDPAPLPSRGSQVPGRHRDAGRLFQPRVASALVVWTQTRPLCV